MSRLLSLLRDALLQGPAGGPTDGRVRRRGLVARHWGRLLGCAGLGPEEVREELHRLAQWTPRQAADAGRNLSVHVRGGEAARRDSLARALAHVPALARRAVRLAAGRLLPLDNAAGLLPLVPNRVPTLLPGSRLDSVGALEVGDFLGGGGFAEVYLAHDPQAGPLSLKVSFRPEGRRLLRHEAWMNGLACGPGILPVRAAFLEAETPALAYPAVAGDNLRDVFDVLHRRGRPPEPRWVAAVLRRLAQALDGLHRRRYAHRDVKPSNVMFGRWEGGPRDVVLLDLGISGPITGLSEDDWPHGPEARRFIDRLLIYSHSRVYASPEQLQYRYEGGYTRASDDVYSAGVVAIQALSGVFDRRADDAPWQAALAARQTPWSFIGLLEACVAPEPRRRPRDGGELAERLDQLLHTAAWPSRGLQGDGRY
jgi:serine/threonine protein kinase